MIPYLDLHLVFGILTLGYGWYASYYSMKYYALKFEIDESIIDDFIQSLRWPIRIAMNHQHKLLEEADPHVTKTEALINRVGFITIAAILPAMYSVELSRTDSTREILRLVTGFLVLSYLIYRFWFFGHKLKSMNSELESSNPD